MSHVHVHEIMRSDEDGRRLGLQGGTHEGDGGGLAPCYLFGMSTQEMLAYMLKLPREERVQVTKALLLSLEILDEEEIAATWAPELERRSREVTEGTAQTIEWGGVQTELLNELAERRARRAAF
ncbi:addiction module protein [Polyangium sorediatum]|uniref:Addiction module protein n=1 Tax=Polyangium sorediatum TaxID=889274 RepID=A0ABT6NQ90_9BACT|nr:addiction module protein [Polyangium sorediatum]MDI1430485.1 addiction module protein [Polyangium sorediatum]